MDDKKRQEISQSIKSHRALDDIIAYLFALLQSERIPTDENKIHNAIFELKKEYPDFFEDFVFSRGDVYPHSKDLERILFRFQQSNILGTMNPTFEIYIFPNKSKKVVLEHLSNKFSHKEKETLLKMSRKLEGLLTI